MQQEVRRDIGQRLKEARQGAKLSQADVATELGVQRQTVSAWERGKSLPGGAEWFKLGLMYGRSLDYLVYGIRVVPFGTGMMEEIFRGDAAQAPPARALLRLPVVFCARERQES